MRAIVVCPCDLNSCTEERKSIFCEVSPLQKSKGFFRIP